MGRPGYPAEFRRKVLDLLAAGRSVASVAHDLDVSDQTIYNWRRQDRIDRGLVAGLSTAEKAERAAAKKRIRELETELAIAQRAVDLLRRRPCPGRGETTYVWRERGRARPGAQLRGVRVGRCHVRILAEFEDI